MARIAAAAAKGENAVRNARGNESLLAQFVCCCFGMTTTMGNVGNVYGATNWAEKVMEKLRYESFQNNTSTLLFIHVEWCFLNFYISIVLFRRGFLLHVVSPLEANG